MSHLTVALHNYMNRQSHFLSHAAFTAEQFGPPAFGTLLDWQSGSLQSGMSIGRSLGALAEKSGRLGAASYATHLNSSAWHRCLHMLTNSPGRSFMGTSPRATR